MNESILLLKVLINFLVSISDLSGENIIVGKLRFFNSSSPNLSAVNRIFFANGNPNDKRGKMVAPV
jgi:hypothetical protein